MVLSGEFHEVFKPRYQRNNKKSGQKNLRCFPHCSDAGHMASGFCGTPLSCVLRGVNHGDSELIIRCWGEFLECGTEDLLKPGTIVPLQNLRAKERSRDEPTLPLLRGDVVRRSMEPGTFDVTFNHQLLGWHYHWVSTKHTCDAMHSFVARVYTQDPGSTGMLYLGHVTSPTFQLYSRRRQRGKVDPAAAQTAGRKRRAELMLGGDPGQPLLAPAAEGLAPPPPHHQHPHQQQLDQQQQQLQHHQQPLPQHQHQQHQHDQQQLGRLAGPPALDKPQASKLRRLAAASTSMHSSLHELSELAAGQPDTRRAHLLGD